jgi:hypothetical protein
MEYRTLTEEELQIKNEAQAAMAYVKSCTKKIFKCEALPVSVKMELVFHLAKASWRLDTVTHEFLYPHKYENMD